MDYSLTYSKYEYPSYFKLFEKQIQFLLCNITNEEKKSITKYT